MKHKKIVSLILSVVMLIPVSVISFGAEKKPNELNACNWMSVIKDDTLISEISIPGTHDSATKNIAVSLKARCQVQSIAEQLNSGARFLDLRRTL